MNRSLAASLLVLPLAAGFTISLTADVKTREKTQIKFEGMLGRVVGMFGGKGARDGIVTSAAVKGNRKALIGDTTSQIIDLDEEKVYDLDMKKKEYEVTTFDELRKRMREAQERAAKDAQGQEGREEKAEKPGEKPQKEFEVDFDAKETGQRKQVAGHDARQVIMTVTVREKGKKIEDGGLVMTADSWLGPEIAALKELSDFDMRYYTKLYGGTGMGLAAEQMAMVMAMYPALKDATERMKKEGANLKGTPLATTTTFEAVKSQAMVEEEKKQNSGGGVSGMLARRMMKKEDPKTRATIFTIQHEFQEVSTWRPRRMSRSRRGSRRSSQALSGLHQRKGQQSVPEVVAEVKRTEAPARSSSEYRERASAEGALPERRKK